MIMLSILFGAAVGFALGLTGGGGSLLAVPMLVYGLALSTREAVGISLAAVGITALLGAIRQIREGQVEMATGVVFAVAGMLGAPLGALLARAIPETALLASFALLMLAVALRMWSMSAVRNGTGRATSASVSSSKATASCRRDAAGRLQWNTRCVVLLSGLGLITGVLSGMFGVGGGFVIVPALVLFAGMPIQRATATSLLVIVLVSISGVASHLVAGQSISLLVTGLFVAGGAMGIRLGTRAGQSLPTAVMQRVFASAIVVVAVAMIGRVLI